MQKGMYIALSGAVLKEQQLELISKNLANNKTLAYKRDGMAFKEYLISSAINSTVQPDGRSMSQLAEIKTDFSDGEYERTGNPLDIAIEGKGFIELENGKYTRRGDLKIDNEGYLSTAMGVKVLGEDGPIQFTSAMAEIIFDKDGTITSGNQQVGRLSIVDFKDKKALLRTGSEYILVGNPEKVEEPEFQVRQNYLEQSNVEMMKEMVEMVNLSREYEAYQKVLMAFQESAQKATNEMAR